jgi:hypothetical protein
MRTEVHKTVRDTITDFLDATEFGTGCIVTNVTRDVASIRFRREEIFYTTNGCSRPINRDKKETSRKRQHPFLMYTYDAYLDSRT